MSQQAPSGNASWCSLDTENFCLGKPGTSELIFAFGNDGHIPTFKGVWSIDVGWASTWVKIVNEWFAATVYRK
ncbi:hypothetical protein Vadar_026091 [Vaccinium darrowii]|uniref:Uncharacterized protein n=1 Tax=Vaccinium darrowii TaxID=229202 RepID=A0ACB7X418_9ERIC|nr:hypothetical protein Vadar_026091 [Vaccinium darrowii]